MAPKRKKAATTTARTNKTTDRDDSQTSDQSPPPSRPTRRSARQRSINDVKKVTEPGVSLRPQGKARSGMTTVDRGETERQIWQSRDGVRRAMKELSDMEERLQTAVKRQRLAVETSDLEVNGVHSKSSEPFSPHPIRQPGTRVVNEKPPKAEVPELKPKLEDLEAAPMSEDEAKEVADTLQEDAIEADPGDEAESADRGANRPPAVNSDYLPLPWKGRLGYACLNTYLRTSTPPVFSSRTCRLASIIQHQHPLTHPNQPEHPKKNPRDTSKPKSVRRGEEFVEQLGLANARDIVKMLRWNDKYGIKFMRLSSEMFPFASHEKHGYSLAPFASEVLAEAGAVAAELGHRLTTHPGQFTQLGSPRKEVVTAAIRDLEYHDELLTLLKLPEQQDRDAVMILHMGGTFGDKAATLDRFRENYARLSPSVKRRLVLENDDVSWSVHDLLPICEELNIPMVLDFHHHNIVFDQDKLREGTKDIIDLFPRIKATWTRKGITQKMHYSESCAGAVTPRDRRKHSARVKTLPPCPPDTDLMIEAKDKEQAVFELMKTFKLPGYEMLVDMVPHERKDDHRPPPKAKGSTKRTPKKRGRKGGEEDDDADVKVKMEEELKPTTVSAEEFGMGGPMSRVCWPEGVEEWLKPKKRPPGQAKTTKVVGDEDDSC